MLIIDCHCHYGKGEGFTGPWDTRASIEHYLQRASEAGINRTVLFATFHSDYRIANYQVACIVNKYPQRFYGFAFVHPVRDKGRIYSMIKVAIEKYGFVGIKVHRYDGRITREICEIARIFRVPVLYDVMEEISICELLAREYPEVNFIIPHLGSFSDNWSVQLSFIDYLTRHSNIYTDTSGVRRFDLLKEAVSRAGAEKILFGSDGPWLHPGLELEKIYYLKLTERENNLILSENFLKLISRISLKFI